MPLTPNGKIDRRALPAPEAEAYAVQAYAAPVGEVEEALAAIWSELLRVERVGRAMISSRWEGIRSWPSR